jgi:hypothetical protein
VHNHQFISIYHNRVIPYVNNNKDPPIVSALSYSILNAHNGEIIYSK